MDKHTYHTESRITWHISVGDLVRIKSHLFTSDGETEFWEYGIEDKKKRHNQILMFPEVDVYLMKSKKIKSFTPGSLEIVSNRF